RLRAIPCRLTERVLGAELPAWVGGIDPEVVAVPVDVGVGVEVLHYRLVAQSLHQLDVGFTSAGQGALFLRDGAVRVERNGRLHGRSSLGRFRWGKREPSERLQQVEHLGTTLLVVEDDLAERE